MLDFAPRPTARRFAFATHDEVRIDGISYEPVDQTENGYVFLRRDGHGMAENFSHTEMARLVELGRVAHERGAFLPESAKAPLEAPGDLLTTLPARDHRRAKGREALVMAFLELERAGKVNRTDKSIEPALSQIKYEAGRFLSQPSDCDDRPIEAGTMVVPKKVGARSLRRWVSAYEDLGISGLYDAVGNRGNRQRRLRPDELAVMTRVVNRYLSIEKPTQATQATIYDSVREAFEKENQRRCAEGSPELVLPSREAVRLAIRSLDPFQCDVAREGREYARRKHAPVGQAST